MTGRFLPSRLQGVNPLDQNLLPNSFAGKICSSKNKDILSKNIGGCIPARRGLQRIINLQRLQPLCRRSHTTMLLDPHQRRAEDISHAINKSTSTFVDANKLVRCPRRVVNVKRRAPHSAARAEPHAAEQFSHEQKVVEADEDDCRHGFDGHADDDATIHVPPTDTQAVAVRGGLQGSELACVEGGGEDGKGQG